MAFASVGGRGTNTAKVAATTITISPNASIPAGALLAVFSAWDNNNQTTADGPMSRQHACTDNQGNVYCTVFSGQDTGQDARSHAVLFIAKLKTGLSTSDTITITHFTGNRVAKAVSLHEFSMDDGKTFAVAGDEGPVQVNTRAADPAAITITGLDSQEYLLLHVLAAEGPATDAYTWDPDYTQIASAGTTGGADDTNMTVNGGFRIATLTSDTVDVTSDTADRDYTQGLVALCEVDEIVDFPTTPVLDDFNRADEDPLDNGTWDTTKSIGSSTNVGARLVSNQSGVSPATGATESSGQYWLEQFTGDCQEVFVSVPVAITADVRSAIVVVLRGEGYRIDNNQEGYINFWQKADAANQGTPIDNLRFGKGQGPGTTLVGLIAHVPLADGARFGIVANTNGLDSAVAHLMVDRGDGEYLDAGAIYYTTPLITDKIGLIFNGTAIRGDDFGGGTCGGFLPQIYRLVLE